MPLASVVAHLAGRHTGLSARWRVQSRAQWRTCRCELGSEPGIVFDPFAGAGTTLLVAKKMGRRWLGCELNPAYVRIATRRLFGKP
ncbi:MAG: DNA methyltransferase [Candidatus Binatia bacterium]